MRSSTAQEPGRLRAWPLIAPLLLELGLGMAMGITGTALAARGGDEEAGAFALAQHIVGLLFILLRIIGAGISVVVAQQLGAQQRGAADRVARASMGASLWMGMGLALLALLGAPAWVSGMNAPDAVGGNATTLLRALAPVMVLEALVAAQTSVLRAHLMARATLHLNLVMHGAHLALAMALMPLLGLTGYALALLASRLLGVGLGARLWRQGLGLSMGLSDLLRLKPDALGGVLAVGLPSAAENILYRVCAMVSVAVAGSLGAAALATQAYAQQLAAITLLPGLAIGLTAEILVGHLVGQGNFRRARRTALRGLALGVVASVLTATAVALASPWLLSFFTQDRGIVAAGSLLMALTVLLEPGRTFNIVVINALRAAGDTRFPVAAGAVSMVLVLGAGSWLLGAVLGWGLVGIWVAYIADEWIRGLIMWWRWQSLKWVSQARRCRPRRPRPPAQPACP